MSTLRLNRAVKSVFIIDKFIKKYIIYVYIFVTELIPL